MPCDGNVDELVAVRLLVPAAGLKLSREAQELTAGSGDNTFLQDLIDWMISREL